MIERNTALRPESGFSLIEMMIVVAIVAILATVGYPAYKGYVYKSYRADAKSLLLAAAARQEEYYLDNKTYTSDLSKLGYDTNADGEVLTEHGAYAVTVDAASATGYTLLATAEGNQTEDGCGNFTLTNLGVKGFSGSGNDCW